MPPKVKKKEQPGTGYWGTGTDIKEKRDKPDKVKAHAEKQQGKPENKDKA